MERHLKTRQAWSKKNPDRNLRSTIGITAAEKYEKLRSQGNACAVCKSKEHRNHRPLGISGWCADHDHATGKFRGVLCSPCNLALGYAKDSPKTLRALVKYLETSR